MSSEPPFMKTLTDVSFEGRRLGITILLVLRWPLGKNTIHQIFFIVSEVAVLMKCSTAKS